jgi:hypothetical protein
VNQAGIKEEVMNTEQVENQKQIAATYLVADFPLRREVELG